MSENTTLIENAVTEKDGLFGFRVEWSYGSHWADVKVRERVAHQSDGKASYQKQGALTGPDWTDNPEESELYLEGFIKWDGCAEFEFGDGADHWCGAGSFKKHIALIEWLYHRAMELMEMGEDDWRVL